MQVRFILPNNRFTLSIIPRELKGNYLPGRGPHSIQLHFAFAGGWQRANACLTCCCTAKDTRVRTSPNTLPSLSGLSPLLINFLWVISKHCIVALNQLHSQILFQFQLFQIVPILNVLANFLKFRYHMCRACVTDERAQSQECQARAALSSQF